MADVLLGPLKLAFSVGLGLVVILPVATSRATIEMGAYAGFDFQLFDNAHGSASIETTN